MDEHAQEDPRFYDRAFGAIFLDELDEFKLL
jgi:hypothetical protein